MSTTSIESPGARMSLRLWPGVVAALLLVVVAYVVPAVRPDYGVATFLGGAAGALVILLWWLLFSRARWYERAGAVAVIAAAEIAQKYFVHESIAGGAMGMMSYVLSVPTLCLALVAWAAVSRRLAPTPRAAAAIAAVVLGCVPWALVRTGGISGSGGSEFHWRWAPTPEDLLLAQARDEPVAPAADPSNGGAAPSAAAPAVTAVPSAAAATTVPAALAPPTPMKAADWPGFRGPAR